MRAALFDELINLAEVDERVFLITGDLGWGLVEGFSRRFPDRFLNAGVAEQNMASLATGLAQAGYIPFIYSIATFISMRCYEQIRNGAVLHDLPVRIIGAGGGYTYGHNGPTHYALEDISIMRVQPGLTVIVPADPPQARSVVRATRSISGPVYIRLGRNKSQQLLGLNGRFALGKAELIRDGKDILFISCGSIADEATRASESLARDGISAAVGVLAHLPFKAGSTLIDVLRQFRFIVTIEDGYVVGGLGSLVAETVAEYKLPCHLCIRGVSKAAAGETGSEDFMRERNDLTASQLVESAKKLMGT